MSEGAGPIWFDIMARVVGMEGAATKIVKDATTAGEQAGTGFSDAFKQRVLGSTTGMTSAMEGQIRSATATLESASVRVVKAKDAEADAAGRAMVAEAKLNEARNKYATDSSKFIAAEQNYERAKRNQIAASNEVVVATNNQARAEEALAAKHDAAVASTRTLSTALSGAAVLGVGAVGFAMGEAVKKAGDFQQSQMRLVSSAGETHEGLKVASAGILDLAGQVGYSAQELSKGMYTVEAAGYHGADAVTVMKAAAQGAKAENADLTEVNGGLTTSMHDFGYAADQANVVMSKMVVAVGSSKANFQQFSAALHSVEPAAAAAHIQLEDVYATLAQMTQTGMSADQATENMRNAINSLSKPTQTMRDEMSQFGISADEVKEKLGERGLAGSMQYIEKAIRDHMNPAQQLVIDTMYQNKTVAADAQKMFEALPPAAQKVAQSVRDGSLSFAEWRKAGGGLTVDQKNLVDQWLTLEKKADGFNSVLKGGQSTIQTYNEALAKATGTVAGQSVALAVTGEHAESTNALIGQLKDTTAEADGSVKGWGDTQETFNQKLAEFKDGLGATAIKLGNDLLPTMTHMMEGLKSGVDWLGDHKGVLDSVLVAVGAIGVGFASWKIANGIASGISAVTAAFAALLPTQQAATAAQVELDVAMDANPIGAIVLAIEAAIAALAGLAFGVKYAYEHWGWFHDGVQKIWETLKSVGSWIGTTFMDVWHHVVGAFDTVKTAVTDVAHTISEFWTGHVSPVLSAIETGFKYAGAIVATVLVTPFVLGFKLIEAVMLSFWHGVTEPVIHGIGALLTWLNEHIVQPTLGWIGDRFTWLNEHVIEPTVGWISDHLHVFGDVMTWLHDSIVKPVMERLGQLWNWLYDHVIRPVIDEIKIMIEGWGLAFQAVHDHVIKPVGDKIGEVMHAVKDVFKDAVDWIETQWKRIEHIVGEPTAFVVNAVYNDGIRPTWNSIAHIFGLPEAPEQKWVPHYAGGGIHSGPGIVPGYAPGQDTVNARLSPGEGVAVPELVQAIGPSNFLALNHMYSGGRPSANGRFAGGGIFDGITSVVGDAWAGIKDTGAFLAKVAKDPAGAIRDLFAKVTDTAQGTPGDPSSWRDALIGIPGKFLNAAIDKVTGWFRDRHGSFDAGNTPWSIGAGAEQWRQLAMQALADEGFTPPEAYVDAMLAQITTESGGNPNIVQQVQDVNSGGNEGVGLLQIIPGTFAAYRDPRDANDRTDPKANMDAALRYMRGAYGGDINGVWGHGHGYSGGGIAGESGPATALAQVKDHENTMYAWGGSDLASGVDCSGLIGDAIQIAMGQMNPTGRLGTTFSMLAGQWPHVLSGASSSDVFSIGTNQDHMAATILGTNIEARQTGEHIRIGSAAASAFDPQFTARFHVDPAIFNPPYVADAKAAVTGGTDKAGTWRDRAKKAKDAAEASTAAAAKHDKTAQDDLAKAQHSEELAAKATGEAKAKHLRQAQRYRDAAEKAKAAAQKARDAAAKHQQTAKDDLDKATKAEQQQSTSTSGNSKLAKDSTAGSSSGGLVTFHDLLSRGGGLLADGILETFGLQDTLLADPNKSPLLRIGSQLANAKIATTTAPINPLAKLLDDASDELPATHDDGGYIAPGLSLVNNKTGRPEPVLNPQQKIQLERAASTEDRRPAGPLLNIENWHTHGDGHADARAVTRELNVYAGQTSR